MVEYECPRCGFSADHKSNITVHIDRKKLCKATKLDVSLIEYREQILDRTFFKIYKFAKEIENIKKENSKFENEIKKIVEENKKLRDENKSIKEENKKLRDSDKKLENTINIMSRMVDKKILSNVRIETIRSQARKIYKEKFPTMICAHCKHTGSTQVCHIKPIADFDDFSLVSEINDIKNLIGLCPNCHIDLDKHKKFEVTRTAALHRIIVDKLS
jgi:predicted HNH restriction endonuclease